MKTLQPNLNPEDKVLMEKLLSAGHIEYKIALRLQTILLRAKGKGAREICEFPGMHPATVSLYINRYNTYGIDSLLRGQAADKPGDKE